jgi:phosphoglucosamine mutase
MKYFGTDGIRGRLGISPIDVSHLNRLARALEKKYGPLRRVVIGRDTRASGTKIKSFLINGFSPSTEFFDCAIVTSPLLSRAIAETGADFGLMITASHNPPENNGVKIFNCFGEKITIEEEEDLEQLMDSFAGPIESHGHQIVSYDIRPRYEMAQDIWDLFPRVAVDCANGAATKFAKESYRFREIDWLGDRPNGQNINANCGSEYPELLCQTVCQNGSDLGIAHDGDGDRLLLCDRFGTILPGEVILGIIAIFLEETGHLHGHQLVTTAMSNGGLRISLERYGIGVTDAEVGDRNVAETMHMLGCNFGGECSGHVLFFDEGPTSDGIQTALLFLKAITFLKISPENACQLISLLPRKSCNILVRKKIPLTELPGLSGLIQMERERIGKSGKVFVRYSMTEPKLRLLVEAEDGTLVGDVMDVLKNNIENCKEFL